MTQALCTYLTLCTPSSFWPLSYRRWNTIRHSPRPNLHILLYVPKFSVFFNTCCLWCNPYPKQCRGRLLRLIPPPLILHPLDLLPFLPRVRVVHCYVGFCTTSLLEDLCPLSYSRHPEYSLVQLTKPVHSIVEHLANLIWSEPSPCKLSDQNALIIQTIIIDYHTDPFIDLPRP